MNETYHAVLNAESELILGVGPLDLDLDHRGARHCSQLHYCLVLRVLKQEHFIGDESVKCLTGYQYDLTFV